MNNLKKYMCLLLICLSLPLSGQSRNGPKWEREPRNCLDRLGKKLAKAHNLRFLNSGFGSLLESKHLVLCVLNFTSQEKCTLEEAAPLVNKLAEELTDLVYNNPLFAKWCEMSKVELNKEIMGFKVTFWDENVDRPLIPI